MDDESAPLNQGWDGKPSWALNHGRNSTYAKERVRWEAFPTELGPGLRPFVFRPYPVAMYRAESADGGPIIAETREAKSAVEEANFRNRGFADSPLEAIELLNKQALEFAKLAAERNFEVRRMGAQAKAEVERFEQDTDGHQPTIEPTPIARPGEHITSDREIKMQAEIDELKALVKAAIELKPEKKKRAYHRKAKAGAE